MICTICYLIGYYLTGYGIGLEDDGSILCLSAKIYTLSAGVIALVAGIIVFLIEIALTNPEISFNLSSAEWASAILIGIAIIGVSFLLGLVFGRIKVHIRILELILRKKLRD